MGRDLSARALAALEAGAGTLRLAPTWVPRSFCVPGRRLKLHPHDLFALGAERGGINERWLASTLAADNGPLTAPEEGLSVVVDRAGGRVGTLAEVVDALGAALLGDELWTARGAWTTFATIFDNQLPLPFHVHPAPKSEAYWFPPQLNGHYGSLPASYLGLRPDVGRDELRERLAGFGAGDNRITELSTAYRLEPGDGWDVPAGVLHAPGTLCTYEPQLASEVSAMCESVNNGRGVSAELLWRDVPAERRGDPDALLELLDWEANVDPAFARARSMGPRPAGDEQDDGCRQRWIAYKASAFSAKEVTVAPGRTATVRDAAPYGLVVLQGHGELNGQPLESPSMIRHGQLTNDEYFVCAQRARDGVVIRNPSDCEPIVLLQQFGPRNPDVPGAPR